MRNLMMITAVARLVANSFMNRTMVAGVVIAHALRRQLQSHLPGQPQPSYLWIDDCDRRSERWREHSLNTFGKPGKPRGGC